MRDKNTKLFITLLLYGWMLVVTQEKSFHIHCHTLLKSYLLEKHQKPEYQTSQRVNRDQERHFGFILASRRQRWDWCTTRYLKSIPFRGYRVTVLKSKIPFWFIETSTKKTIISSVTTFKFQTFKVMDHSFPKHDRKLHHSPYTSCGCASYSFFIISADGVIELDIIHFFSDRMHAFSQICT